MKLIVGLGNPGYAYHLSPHNLGFMVADLLAERWGREISRPDAQSLTAEARFADQGVLLAKPQTYMNLSGSAVARLLTKYQAQVADLIVVYDDVDLPFGSIRIRTQGSAGTHNGFKSVIGALQSDEFVRLRMGIQPDHPVGNLAAYVLRPFRKADLETVAGLVERSAEAIEVILKEGVQTAMNRFNRREQNGSQESGETSEK